MHRDADAAIPVTLDVQKAITCDIEPNIRGGPTWIVFHVDEGPLMWPDNADDYDEDGPYDRAFKEYQANAEKYCRYLLDTLAERLVQDNEPISDNPRPKLLQNLDGHFSEEDLRTLCFELVVDYENLPAQGKVGKARELILHLERSGRIPEFIDRCRQLRPNISWEDTSGT